MSALSGRTAIVGIGQTEFSKESGRTELQLACEAVKAALDDAGLTPADVDGLVTFSQDTTEELELGRNLGFDEITVEFGEAHLDGHVDPGVGRCDVDEVADQPDAFGEVDQRHDVGVVEEGERRVQRHHEAVQGSLSAGLDRVPLQRVARGAHRARRMAEFAARDAALDAQDVFAQTVPEERGVGRDGGSEGRGHHVLPGANLRMRKRCRPTTSPASSV